MDIRTRAKKAQTLQKAAETAARRNEYNAIRFCGVGNVSRSDLDTVILYCDIICAEGQYTPTLMKPRGAVAAILEKNGLLEV